MVRVGCKKTELGEIPANWHIKTLGEIGKFTKGKGIAKKDISKEGMKCILYGQLYTTYKERILSVNTFTNTKVKNPVIGQSNDLLFPSSGETAIDIATSSALNTNNVYIGGDINLFRPSTLIDSNFLSYQINSIRKADLSKLAQGSSVYHLYADNLANFKVVLPPLNEQQKIADILSTLDDQIQQTDQLIKRTKELKKGLMQKLVIKGTGHSSFKETEVGKIPVTWTIAKVDDIADFVGSGVTPRGGQKVYKVEGIPFIRSQNVYPEGLVLEDIVYIDKETNKKMNRSEVQENDVLLNITGASIGRCTYVPVGFGKANVNQHVCIIRSNGRVLPTYLSNYINSSLGQIQIKKSLNGSSREGLNYQQVRALLIAIPPIEEQQKISNILGTVDNRIRENTFTMERLLALKKGLMQQLLTGKIRVKV